MVDLLFRFVSEMSASPYGCRKVTRALILAGICTAACAEPDTGAPRDDADGRLLPVISGSTVDSDTDARGGFVALSLPGFDVDQVFCSGTLYNNSTLVTAKHCLSHPQTVHLQSRPRELMVTMGRSSTQQLRNGQTVWFHRSKDLALVQVSSPFNMPRNSDNVMSTSGYGRSVIDVTAGSPVLCFGYGRSSETCDSGGNNCSGTGTGTLRTAMFTAQRIIDSANNLNFYRYERNAQGQVLAHGDSGGGCVTFSRIPISLWKQPLISVTSQASPGKYSNAEPALDVSNANVWQQVSP